MELITLILLFIIVGSLAYGAVSAAPWVPVKKRDLVRALEIANPKPGELMFELGSGDGRVVIAAAKQFKLNVIGYEVAVLPYLVSQLRLVVNGLTGVCKIRLANFWSADLSSADIIFCFLTPPVMGKLAHKLSEEMKPGARFVSYAFSLPNQEAEIVSKPLNTDINIYLYTKIVRPVGRVVDR